MLVRRVEASGSWESQQGLNRGLLAIKAEMWTSENGFYFFPKSRGLYMEAFINLCKQGIYIWYDTSLSFGIVVFETYFRS